MLRGILAGLGAGVVVTGLTSTVYAQPILRSQSQTGFVRRSSQSLHGVESRHIVAKPILRSQSQISSVRLTGQPLHGVESRDIANDYPIRFSETAPNSLAVNSSSYGLGAKAPGHSKTSIADFLGGWGNKLKVDVGSSYMDGNQLFNVQYLLRNH